MQSMVAVLAVSMVLAGGLQAQDRKAISEEQKQEMVENRKADLERLALSDEQKKKYIAVNKKFAAELKEVKSVTDKAAKREKMESLKTQRDAEIAAMLTPEQQQTYTDIQAERKAKRQAKKSKR